MANTTQGILEYIDEDGTSTAYRIGTSPGPIARTLLASAARTTTQTSPDQTNPSCRGIDIILDVTSAGTGSLTLTIDGKDPASGKWFNLLTGAAVTTNSTTVYRVFPGAPGAGSATVNDMVPALFRIVVTANNANSVTYSVGYILTP